MTPRKVAEHAYEGSQVTIQNGRYERRGVVSHCNADGATLYCRLYRSNGFELMDHATPVPASAIKEIRHGPRSKAPENFKKTHFGAIR